MWADAAIYRLTDDIAIVQTLDFFTPIVNEPYDFGRIAAANAFSDIYAMGGKPLTAMNIVCFPINDMDKSILRAIIEGGLEIIHKAGAVMAGGHSVQDAELKYGLSVTGIVHPKKFVTNEGAKPGDILILTKPIGTGVLSTALKARKLDEGARKYITELMATLNKEASEIMCEIGVNACTDITGFGLLGHSINMAMASNVGIKIYIDKVPFIKEAIDFASMGLIPAGSYMNQRFCSNKIMIKPNIDTAYIDLLADAQTSGGLLISVSPDRAEMLIQRLREKNTPSYEVIGEVISEPKGVIQVC